VIYLRYGIPRALRHLRRHPAHAFNSALVIAAALSVLGMITLLYLNVQHVSRLWLSNTTLSLFLEPGIPARERAAVLDAVQRHPLVRTAREVTPQQGLNDLAEKLGTDHALLRDAAGGLPYTIEAEVFLDQRDRLAEVARRLRRLSGVDDVVYAERVWEQVDLFFTLTRGVGLFFIGLILVAFYLIVSNAVRLSMYARREEIEILTLIGASRPYIRSAFVVEGVLVSLVGSLLALGIVWFCYELLLAGMTWSEWTMQLRRIAVFYPRELLAGAVLTAAALGGISSRISVNHLLARMEP